MGQRRGHNETTLTRHVWRRDTGRSAWECACHGLMITDKVMVEFGWLADKLIGTWTGLDLIMNILENGVEDEFRPITREARYVRLEKWIRESDGPSHKDQEVPRYPVEWPKNAG